MKSQFKVSNYAAGKNRLGPRFPKLLPRIHKSVASNIAFAFPNNFSRTD